MITEGGTSGDPGQDFIAATLAVFTHQKSLAERAIEQLTDEQLHTPIAPGLNSIAIIIQHMSGSMKSRWTDFLTTDGEKPTRARDAEFVDERLTRHELMTRWNDGWAAVLGAVGGLSVGDVARDVTIRGQTFSVSRAVLRQVDHYAYHVAQIVTTARVLAGPGWKHLSIPPGGTASFNASLNFDPSSPGAPSDAAR